MDMDISAEETGPESGSEVDEELERDLVDDSIFCLAAHADSVYAVAWADSSQKVVATGGGDDLAFLWKLVPTDSGESPGPAKELSGHEDSVSVLAFNASGQQLATGGLDGIVCVWAARNGALLHTLEGPAEAVEWLAWHPGGALVAAGSEDFTAWIWDAEDGSTRQVLAGHSGPVRCGCFNLDGSSLITGGGENDMSLRIWSTSTGDCTAVVSGHLFHSAGLTSIALHPQGTAALTGGEDGSLFLTALPSARITSSLPGHTDSIEDAVFCPVLPVAMTASIDGQVIIWDHANTVIRHVCKHPEGVTRLACHASQPLLFTACLDGIARCWDIRSGACIRSQSGHSSGIQDMALHCNGQLLLTASDDQTARVFDFGMDDTATTEG
ncbi:hypothetical protein WJX84_003631 [Apatococcus fuscideae]|uniref:Angio-associated migratory cell protein n=1 Tax=Apatococcus fuscideae TaxID=2026836 RepID=A0AAW1TJ57_9CHLO